MYTLNKWQRTAARAWAGGEYDWVQSLKDCEEVGIDELFSSIMRELGGVRSHSDAVTTLEIAISELSGVLLMINNEAKYEAKQARRKPRPDKLLPRSEWLKEPKKEKGIRSISAVNRAKSPGIG
jgi:hypothetical protein